MWFWLFIGRATRGVTYSGLTHEERGESQKWRQDTLNFLWIPGWSWKRTHGRRRFLMFAIMSMFNRMTDWRKGAVTLGALNAGYTFTELWLTRYFSVSSHLKYCALNVVCKMFRSTMYMYRCGSSDLTLFVGCKKLDAEQRSSWNVDKYQLSVGLCVYPCMYIL